MQSILIIAVVLVVLYFVFRLFKTLVKWFLICALVLVAIAFFSNPDADAHRDKLTQVKKEFNREMKEKKVVIDDYKIFSVTKRKVNGDEKIVGVGAFGKVWYFGEEK